jgi:pimeloyl-ACP methyl ester carboxylesterase
MRGLLPMLLITTNFVAMSSVTEAADPAPKYAEHQDLSYFLDGNAQKQPIKSPVDWAKRRDHIAAWLQTVMGPLPQPEKPVPLDVKVEEEATVGELTRKAISYHTDSTERRVKAFLFLPKTVKKPVPAILCLHQTIGIGKSEPAGLGGNPNLHYALHLAQRGYVTLAPDYPSFGEYPYDFDAKHGYTSGSMKAIYDNIRAVDLLQSHPDVDQDRIGCTGHSLGGHNAMFTAFFEPRIKCLVSNCGFTRFHKYYNGALKGWTSSRYMPLIDSRHHNSPDEVPFDFPEIVAGFAPRPFLASSPIGDRNFEVSGVKDAISSAQRIYELLGVPDALQANYPNCAHDFPEDVRKVAYEFFDKHLQR